MSCRAGLSIGQENMMKELVKAKDELSRSNEDHENNARKDHQRMQELHARIMELDETKKQHIAEIQTLKEKIVLKTVDNNCVLTRTPNTYEIERTRA